MTESEIVSGVSMNCVQRRKQEMNSRRSILSSRPDRVSSGCRGKIPENIRSSASCGRQKHKHKIVQAVVYTNHPKHYSGWVYRVQSCIL